MGLMESIRKVSTEGLVVFHAYLSSEEYLELKPIDAATFYPLLDDFSLGMMPYEPRGFLWTQTRYYGHRTAAADDPNYLMFKQNKNQFAQFAEHLGDRIFENLFSLSEALLVEPKFGIWNNEGELIRGFLPSNFVGETWKNPNTELLAKIRGITM